MATFQVTPHSIAHLAFSYAAPSDWKIADVPAEGANFDDPKFFLPRAAAVSGCGSGAFTVGARPAYGDGALPRMRNLYIEDGERLFAICTMAPDALYDGIAPILATIAGSFQVDNPAGPTVPLAS